jgi:peptidoglycan/LPS O-acetylase OafA/YrhL
MDDPASPAGGREFDLDPFRGLVCLWLMGLHLCYMSEAYGALLRLVGPDAAEALFHVRLGVESFLVPAGFMMAHMLRPVPGEAVSLRAYFLRRCYRLLLPFWVAVLLAAADKWAAYFSFAGGSGRPSLFDAGTQLLLANEFFGVPEPAVGYWSLATLEQFYVLWLGGFAAVRLATRGAMADAAYRRAVARLATVGLGVFLASGVSFLTAGPEAVHLAGFAFYVALGSLLYGHTRLGVGRWEFRLAVVALVAAAVGFLHSRLTAAVTTGVLYALARGARFPTGPVFRVLRFVGRRAYSVYAMHAIVGLRVLSGFRLLSSRGDWLAIPLIVAAGIASLVATDLFFRLVERHCQNLARRVRYRTPGPGSPS